VARIVFMGTPQFAVPALEALAAQHDVVGVVTQPDRAGGRGQRLLAAPIKEAAQARGLPIFQPRTLRTPEALEHLAAWRPDVIVVAAFGQILRAPVLELPPHGCLNIHASLLPRYRGAAPIPAAILNGESTTGVTIMRLDEGLDTGPILAQAELPIRADDTTGSLTARLADLGARLLSRTLPGWLTGDVLPRPQNVEKATYCQLMRKKDGQLDWTNSAAYLERQIRACDPWPGAYTTWQGQRLKILRARPRADWPGEAVPGLVLALEPGVGVSTGQGLLELLEVQLAGKKPLAAELFIRGQRKMIGSRLGT